MLSLYEVAFHLKIPLYRLTSEMPYDELLGWYNYFERRPIGWREDDRTYKLLQAQGVKEKPFNLFQSLEAIYNQPTNNEKLNLKSFKKSAFFSKILSAKGGDKIDFNKD